MPKTNLPNVTRPVPPPPPLYKTPSFKNTRLFPSDKCILTILLGAIAIPRWRRRRIAELAAPLRDLGQLGLQAGSWAVHLEPPAALPVWMIGARSVIGRYPRGREQLGVIIEEVV